MKKSGIKKAASSLREYLIPQSPGFYLAQGWLEAIGVGDGVLIVYARENPPFRVHLPAEWEGWPVRMSVTGGMRIGGVS